ncbi:MAG: RIP metalloprotease RseP [Verrucomicrobiia bacterium]
MSQLLNVLYIVAGVLLLFGAAIFVHEWGHYIVARLRGLKVEAFAIGMGPKIFSWVRDGIEYSIRWIPAGGFVRLPQMITSEALEGGSESREPLPPASPWSRILVAFAGPAMNVVFAFVIAGVIYFTGLPVLVNPSFVGYVDPNSPEGEAGIREGDRIVAVDGKSVRSWQEVQEQTVLARTNVLAVVIEREGQRKTYQLEAAVNPDVGLKLLRLEPRDHPEIMEVLANQAGEAAGLKAGDIVLKFAGVPISSREQFIQLIEKRPGDATPILLKRGTNEVALTVTPRLNPATNKGRIGVALNSPNVYQVQQPGPTPWAHISDVWTKTINVLSALVHSKQTGVGVKDLSGPPGILAMLAAYINTDYRLALSFLVLLNVNLAVLNLLPVPVLDGGHIMMAIVERIRRRPLSVKFVEYTTTAFAVALISFMLYVSFNDIRRFSLFRSMFQIESRIESSETPATSPAPEPAPAPQQ